MKAEISAQMGVFIIGESYRVTNERRILVPDVSMETHNILWSFTLYL
jgi:hypothetical protein